MEINLNLAELTAERNRALALAAIAQRHGYADAYNAQKAMADALDREIAERS